MSAIRVSPYSYEQADAAFFDRVNIPLQEVDRQRGLLTAERPFRTHADRACTVPDGILRIEGESRTKYITKGREAIQQGRLTDFVPASGAATRMFADLLEARKAGSESLARVPDIANTDKQAGAVLKIFNSLRAFAFYAELRQSVLARTGSKIDLDTMTGEQLLRNGYGELVISAMVDPEGLGLASKPKALIPFHTYTPSDIRSALAEHLHTAVAVGPDQQGVCRVHFTCSPEHMEGFEREANRVAEKLQEEHQIKFDITFSIQAPSTDTVCVDSHGELVRDADGNPVLRPGGHGALLFNLEQLAAKGADAVYLNNIDNVHPESQRGEFVDSKLLLLGVLVETQAIAHAAVKALRNGMSAEGVDQLYDEISAQIGLTIPDEEWNKSNPQQRATLLQAALDRPVRVVGVVKNTGEPGGGPFWVRGTDGRVTRQLVERHELDPNNQAQQELFNTGTHFNPVRMVCGLKDVDGNPYRLGEFVNDSAVLISEKTVGGNRVKIIERPGLWNGSMDGHITVFVEVDEATFAPVKSVADLARPAHQCNSNQ